MKFREELSKWLILLEGAVLIATAFLVLAGGTLLVKSLSSDLKAAGWPGVLLWVLSIAAIGYWSIKYFWAGVRKMREFHKVMEHPIKWGKGN